MEVAAGAWAAHRRSVSVGLERKFLSALAMLVSREIWLERNDRVFRNKSSTVNMLFDQIKEKAVIWCHAGGKALCNIICRESKSFVSRP